MTVLAPRTTLLLAAALGALACGGSPRAQPTPAATTQSNLMDDTTWDTQVLGTANTTANEVIRNAGDCEVAKPLIAEARSHLDAAEPKLRTAAGRASLDATRRQVAKIADLCP